MFEMHISVIIAVVFVTVWAIVEGVLWWTIDRPAKKRNKTND